MALRPGGGFVVAGMDSASQLAVAAFRSDGMADPIFDGDHQTRASLSRFGYAGGVVVQPDGRVVVAGTRLYQGFGALQYDQDAVVVRFLVDLSGPGRGYSLVASDGGVFAFGRAPFLGSTGDIALAAPVVGMADARTGSGYWLAASDGGVFTFGDIPFLGSAVDAGLDAPVVGIAAGSVLVAADGEVFIPGRGVERPLKGISLNSPIVGVAGVEGSFWLVAADGGVFTVGSAPFLGSAAGLPLNQPVVGIGAHPSGRGYWLVAADGGVLTFGDVPFVGSLGATRLNQPIVGMAADPDGNGYWLAGADGGVFAFGDAPFLGSMGNTQLARPVVAITTRS